MVKHFDHLTIVVQDLDRAKAFFALLGFGEAISSLSRESRSRATWVFPASKPTMLRSCWKMPLREPRFNSCDTIIRKLFLILTSATCTRSA